MVDRRGEARFAEEESFAGRIGRCKKLFDFFSGNVYRPIFGGRFQPRLLEATLDLSLLTLRRTMS
jgi:hypothetical protein